eukprot:gene14006-16556_t
MGRFLSKVLEWFMIKQTVVLSAAKVIKSVAKDDDKISRISVKNNAVEWRAGEEDSHGIDMLEREPECLHKIDMVPAAHMILDLQAFLDRDSISSVTQIFQRCPSLLWQKSAAVLVEAATARIEGEVRWGFGRGAMALRARCDGAQGEGEVRWGFGRGAMGLWARCDGAQGEEIEPRADALTVVKENPDLLYRITRYTRWSELPIDIQ